jgi:hypothetical protein
MKYFLFLQLFVLHLGSATCAFPLIVCLEEWGSPLLRRCQETAESLHNLARIRGNEPWLWLPENSTNAPGMKCGHQWGYNWGYQWHGGT